MKRLSLLVPVLCLLFPLLLMAGPPQSTYGSKPRQNTYPADSAVRRVNGVLDGLGFGTAPAPRSRGICSCSDGTACVCDCQYGGACPCGSSCVCFQAKSDPNVKGPLVYWRFNRAYERAVRENRPLLIWVAEVCIPCERKMTQYVHTHLGSYAGEKDVVREPSVIVAKPDGKGGLIRLATLPGIPSEEDISRALSPPPVQQTLAPAPQFFAPPPAVFFGGGGFGGGFGGGGRGGC